MGWANDAFTRELERAGIFPVNNNTSSRYIGGSTQRTPKKNLIYYEYDFPTEAQMRALRFITMHTGLIYEGKSKEGARKFIKENLDYAKEEANG